MSILIISRRRDDGTMGYWDNDDVYGRTRRGARRRRTLYAYVVAECSVFGRQSTELGLEHEAQRDHVTVEQHPTEHVYRQHESLDCEHQFSVGHVVRDWWLSYSPVVVARFRLNDARRHDPGHERDVADAGERAQQRVQRVPVPSKRVRMAVAARREREPRHVQHVAQPVRFGHDHVALVQAQHGGDHHDGHERERLQIVRRQVQTVRLHHLQRQRQAHKRQNGGTVPVTAAAGRTEYLVQSDRFEKFHVHQGLVITVVHRVRIGPYIFWILQKINLKLHWRARYYYFKIFYTAVRLGFL